MPGPSRKSRPTLCTGVCIAIFLVTPTALAGGIKVALSSKLSEVLHQPVELGSYSISLKPPQAVLKNLIVGEKTEDAGGNPLARVDSVIVSYVPESLLQGQLRFGKMTFKGAHFHVGIDKAGKSSFRAFLKKMMSAESKGVPSLGELEFEDSTVTFHAPKKITAPKGKLKPGPVTARIKRLTIRNISPQEVEKGKPISPRDNWIAIAYEKLQLRSPVLRDKDEEEKGEPAAEVVADGIPEGVDVQKTRAEINWLEKPRPVLRIRKFAIEGLRGRSELPKPGETETFSRIWKCLRAGLIGPPGKKEDDRSSWGIYIEDIKLGDSQIEIAGPDPQGHPAHWRLNNLKGEGRKLAFGSNAPFPDRDDGVLKLKSTTNSSEGEGVVKLTFQRLSGRFPHPSCLVDLEVKHLALPAVSTRLGNSDRAGFARGTISGRFSGDIRHGWIHTEGHIVVSSDTKLVGKDGIKKRSKNLAKIATGRPVEPIQIRGTLKKPEVVVPAYAQQATREILRKISSNDVARFIKRTVGAVVKTGAETIQKTLEVIPVFGEVFGRER